MLTKFQTTIDQKFPFMRTAELYLAISGGKDSMTLSRLLLESGIKHVLLHCNFQLRGKESDQDEQFLKAYAAKNQLEIHVQQFNTAQLAEEQKLTIQECARNLRYEWFRTFLAEKENAFLLTAHHLDDSIETFFINLLRGTGFRGLSGIPVNENKIVRPLSDFTAEEIYRYIDANNIDYRSDSSNAKKDYLRNKVRHDLIPVLADLEPQFQQKMSAVFEELSALKAYIAGEVYEYRRMHQKHEKGDYNFGVIALRTCRPVFLEQLFRPFGIHRKNSGAFFKFLFGETGAQFRTADFHFLIDRDDLVLVKHVETASSVFIEIENLDKNQTFDSVNLKVQRTKKTELLRDPSKIQQLDFAKVKFPLIIRNWQQGDKMKPLGMPGTKMISDILIDKKISQFDKGHQLVMIDSTGNVICLLRLVISEDVRMNDDTREVIEISSI